MAAETVEARVAHIEATAGAGQKAFFVCAYTGGYGPGGYGQDFREFYGSGDTVYGGHVEDVSAASVQMASFGPSDVIAERDPDGTVNVEFITGGVHRVASLSPEGVVSIGESGGVMSPCAAGSTLAVAGI